MNIFVTDISPIKSAQNLDDKRVRHMSKEAFECISIAIYKNTQQCIAPFIIWNREHRSIGDKFEELFNNSIVSWVLRKREHIWWLWCHANAIHEEYRFRFNSVHYLEDAFLSVKHFIPIANESPKAFPNASGNYGTDIFENYKKCLNEKWFVTDEVKPCLWTRRGKPNWANEKVKVVQSNLFQKELSIDSYNDVDDDLPF